ncbi:Calcium/calmodulin-dependent protein kinase [Handroanthus impetiginosus]|uniref:Calcium/calmodulin-dependent protein kinase n=1 Tax=Handroanthus impetiginosus TaxID=429701 RepID=A0A2G9I161_9LAMI|nr:Calcium/calmodulin-dependent protein kinase [Handroanthus impetiginosus]
MVQRKVANKLALQSDHHVKSLSQNKGTADLKKKMKKSGSVKRPELDTLLCPSLKKPPPNYMKPTSSSDARKEQSQSQVSPNTSSSRRKSSSVSKVGLCCSNKSTKTSVKTSSLKMMRSLTKNPSFKPARGYVRKCSPVVLCENIDAKRATCASTLKDCKFPDYLSLNPEGTSTVKVCPYTYCSLNGHHHRASLPPLKCFLSARRRVIKNVKLGCLSPKSVKPISPTNEEEQRDFFVEIYSKKNEEIIEEVREESAMETLSGAPISYDDVLESLDENRDVNAGDADNIYFSEQNHEDKVESMSNSEASEYDYEYLPETEVEPDPEEGKDEFAINSDNKGCNFNDILADEVSQESFDERSLNSDAFSTSDNGESTYAIEGKDEFMTNSGDKGSNFNEFVSDEVSQESFHEESFNSDAFSNFDNSESTGSCNYLQSLNDTKTSEIPLEEPEPAHDANLSQDTLLTDQGRHENLIARESHSEVSQNLKTTNAATSKTEDGVVSRATTKRKKLVEENYELGLFNPRRPNFLPVEPDPEAEKVDLRHQDLDERKNAEEWMVDYALRKVVTKLGPARKKKVALLVEAFEKVMPVSKCDIPLRHGSGFDQARTIQACR